MIVLDASAAVEWLLRTPAGVRVEARLFSDVPTIHAPHLIDVEVVQTLRRLVRARMVTADRAAEVLEDMADLAIVRHAHHEGLLRLWELRENLTAYDAAYVVLAEILDAPLITCDSKAASAPGHRARIEVI